MENSNKIQSTNACPIIQLLDDVRGKVHMPSKNFLNRPCISGGCMAVCTNIKQISQHQLGRYKEQQKFLF